MLRGSPRDHYEPKRTIATFQSNISQHFNATYRNIVGRNMLGAFGHPVERCCEPIMIATCWVLLAQIWKWSNFSCNVCGCCRMLYCRLARFAKQCCTRACELVRFSIPNMSQHVATGWPNTRNMLRPTMLQYVVLKCCDRFARACICWANNVMLSWYIAIVWSGL